MSQIRLKKHIQSLYEVLDEIESALEDPEGVIKHQRRLAMMLSLGMCDLVEVYFHKLGIMKGGSRIQHDWFRKKDVKDRLSNQIIMPLDGVSKIDRIIELAKDVEEKRDDIAYGSPLGNEEILMDKINRFFELKKIIEDEVGETIE